MGYRRCCGWHSRRPGRLQCYAFGKAAGWLEDIARTQDGRRVKTCEECTDCLEPAA